ncbi:MAG: thermonuclease family protein [Thermoanaerobaculales bacterium]|nr:thermonuclease family protein [Thermoanaerobaculales bacterium]
MRNFLFILLLVLILAVATSAAANTLVVAEVHGGDLVEFEGGFTVHLTGIVVPGRTTQIGWKAFDFTKRRLEGKRVAVFTWTTDDTAAGIVLGEDGLAFAKISYGKGLSIDIAAELLERGFARVDPDRLPEGYDHYREIERRAKDQQVGIWASL